MARSKTSGRVVTFEFEPWDYSEEVLRAPSTRGDTGYQAVKHSLKLDSYIDAVARESVYDLLASTLEWLRERGETPETVMARVRANVRSRRPESTADRLPVTKAVVDAVRLASDPNNRKLSDANRIVEE